MKKLFFTITIVSLALFCLSNLATAKEQYYGFYESNKGAEYKEFRHNIFGFSVDIPSDWMFGVVTKDNIPVVLLYPEGLNTGKFSSDYETIEIGEIPLKEKMSLADSGRAKFNPL